MKILIVSSGDVIFRQLAYELYCKILPPYTVELVEEESSISIFKIFKQRLKRAGLLAGLSQFLFKIYDVLVVRRKISKQCALEIQSHRCKTIPPLNSPESHQWLRQSQFDVVIAIASSIISTDTLTIPKYGFVNLHPGILPQYRGTGNLWAVINEDWQNIGCTCHWMTTAIDAGKIICSSRIRPDFQGLWEMNYAALLSGMNALADTINNGHLLAADETASVAQAGYYSWYGFGDYLKFTQKLKRFHRRNVV